MFPDLPIGTYSLKISAADSTRKNRPGLTLLTGQVIDLPIAMAVGAQTQQITVTSETQQIETSTSTVAQSVTQQQMRDLAAERPQPAAADHADGGRCADHRRHRKQAGG